MVVWGIDIIGLLMIGKRVIEIPRRRMSRIGWHLIIMVSHRENIAD